MWTAVRSSSFSARRCSLCSLVSIVPALRPATIFVTFIHSHLEGVNLLFGSISLLIGMISFSDV